jgi:DNA-binding response OmpR family regulator
MSNPRILLVDDDTQFLEATEYMLKYENYEVITAKNGEEAIKKFKESKKYFYERYSVLRKSEIN